MSLRRTSSQTSANRDRMIDAAYFVARYVFALAVALTVAVIVIKADSGDVHKALSSMWEGAFGAHVIVHQLPIAGTKYSLLIPSGIHFDHAALATTLVRTGPLILTGLGVAIAFQARMWNIGGQGQFLLGALLACAIATRTSLDHAPRALLIPIMMLAGAFAGAIWAGIAAVLKALRNVPEVISTIMLNFVAIYLLSYLVNGPLQRADHSQPATEELGANATLPILVHETSLHAGLLLVVVAAVLVWVMLRWTRTGFSISVVGASPDAASLYGHNVLKTSVTAMVWSGALCGLAGAIELSGVLGNLPEGYAPDFGFTAVAVALLGRLQIGGVILSALLFGGLAAGGENMERSAGIGHELGFVVQAALLLVLLAAPAIRFLQRPIAARPASPDIDSAVEAAVTT